MREIDGVEATFINFDNYRLKYKSTRQKVENFFSKNLAGKNIKKEHCTKQVKKDIEALGHQDSILVIRPDKLQGKLLEHLKKKSDRLMGFYFDSITNFPKKAEIIPLFDKVFSYEPTDARDFNLEFVTNFKMFIPKYGSVSVSYVKISTNCTRERGSAQTQVREKTLANRP